MRLQEVHPSIVHFPITLLPLAVGADLLGHVTGSERLRAVGRAAMPAAAGSAALAAVAGLVAQEAVRADGMAHDMLVTHRNVNLGVLGVAAAMAAWRRRQDRPGVGYLALGLASLAAVTYSAYLGGHMVYEHGVGVEAAGGVRDARAPELTPAQAGDSARATVENVREGAGNMVRELREGEVAPTLTGRRAREGDVELGGV
jgi:uncharacterized membrane protein